MQIKSILPDQRIEASNVLVELNLKEYLSVAPYIIDKNEYQRKRVIKSKIKEILRDDLLRGCSIPPIVLSVQNKELTNSFNFKDFSDGTLIEKAFADKSLLIIDGLQRTFVILSLEEELKKSDPQKLSEFYDQKIRAEIYVGLNRLGILYRMITLNTGQTTMSTRHLMEIVYLDYLKDGIDGIKFITDKDGVSVNPKSTTEFRFKDVLDGFNSYIERDENLIERTEILDNIKTLDNLNNEGNNKDLFKEFIIIYQDFLNHINSNFWTYKDEDFTSQEYKIKSPPPFGKSPVEIFKRSQAFTGFGAALSHLKKKKSISFGNIKETIKNIHDEDYNESFKRLLKHLDTIKERSKKIGNDQRYFFRSFFTALNDSTADTYCMFGASVEQAFKATRADRFTNNDDEE